jgi:hypothetical protein
VSWLSQQARCDPNATCRHDASRDIDAGFVGNMVGLLRQLFENTPLEK